MKPRKLNSTKSKKPSDYANNREHLERGAFSSEDKTVIKCAYD